MNLPLDLAQWTVTLSARTLCRFEVLSDVVESELDRRRSMLQKVYPGDLMAALNGQVAELNQNFNELKQDLWPRVRLAS